MINIGKKDTILSYVSYTFGIISNIIILPLVLILLSTEEYGIWNIFISVQGLIYLLDLGISDVTSRYITYSYCGALKITKKGVPTTNKNGIPNYNLLFKIFFISKNIYNKIAFIGLIVSVFFSFYIFYISKNIDNNIYIVIAWLIFALGFMVRLKYTYHNALLKGLGKIKEIQLVTIITFIFTIIIKIILLILGFGLLALSISSFISILINRFLIYYFVKKFIKKNNKKFLNTKTSTKKYEEKAIKHAIWYNSKRIGMVAISYFIQGQGTTLICSAFLSLSEIAMLGLTMQLIGVISNFASIPFNTFITQLNAYKVSRMYEKLKNLFSFVSVAMWSIYFVGIVFLLLINRFLIPNIEINTTLLPTHIIILLLIYKFIVLNHQKYTKFISVGNEQPYVKAYIISSIASLIVPIFIFKLSFGLAEYVISIMIIQIAYNSWKWPVVAFRIVDLKFNEVFVRTLKITYNYLRTLKR